MQQLTIGAFARLTHLSVKTLRYYHDVGLLEPTVVDPDSGYRYYQPGQTHSAQLVRRFRDLGLPVADVKAVLAAPDLAAVDSLRRMLEGGPDATAIEERLIDGSPAISAAAHLMRKDVASWFLDALAGLRAIATAAGLKRTGPFGGLYDDELFTQDAGHARVYLPVADTAALDGTAARWELPAGRYAVALHAGPHRDVDRTYAALGTYAGALGRDGSGPVRERYLTDPLDNPDSSHWRTEVCWPLASWAGLKVKMPAGNRAEASGSFAGTIVWRS
jgi:DNA-binding transcriptional MerR regulator/effector-binding domain-containing protein